MKILLIEDDEYLADLVIEKLNQQKQHVIEWSNNGSEGLELAQLYEYDIILLDVALPQLDGIQVCRQLREKGNRTPILLLTAHDNITKKVAGLDAGADDYLVKPFDVRELLARIRALSRRGNDVLLPILQWENITLDPNNCQVFYRDKPLKLTAKEYSVLELFLRNPHRIFSQSSLIEKIWSWEESPSENAVRTQIKGLRAKIREVGGNPNTIETIYGLGYRLKKASEIADRSTKQPNNPMLEPQSPVEIAKSPQSSLSGIWDKYHSQYRERISILEEAVGAIKNQVFQPNLQEKAIHTAHTLVGSLGSFGYTESSQICSEIEVILQSYDNSNSEISLQLEQLLAQLRVQIDSPFPELLASRYYDDMTFGNDEPDSPNTAFAHQYKLLIVDDDLPLTEALVLEAITWGIEAKVAQNLSSARDAIAETVPDAILLDLAFPEAKDGGFKLLQELNEQKLTIPVIALTARESFADRIEVARLGGKGFLTKPVSPTQTMQTVASIIEQSHLPNAKVLVVDNQQENLDTIEELLQPWKFEIVLLQDTIKFWDTLEQFNPDLIIAQLEMENVSGIELTQVVRNDPRWSHLPVLLMSSHEDIKTIQQIYAVGVDDRISLPIVGEELLARIFNRLDKERYRRHQAETDSLTGIFNRRASIQQLNRLLSIARRQNKPWCFVIIDLDNFKQINDNYGHEAGDRVLRKLGQLLKQEFRSEDVTARWGGEEFVLGLYDMTKEAVISRLRTFLTTFSQQNFARSTLTLSNPNEPALTDSQENHFNVTFSAGVAEYPINGSTLESLYQLADMALYRAKAEGKSKII
jgi:diguanylate cyclase (GGDEF)-like protein